MESRIRHVVLHQVCVSLLVFNVKSKSKQLKAEYVCVFYLSSQLRKELVLGGRKQDEYLPA